MHTESVEQGHVNFKVKWQKWHISRLNELLYQLQVYNYFLCSVTTYIINTCFSTCTYSFTFWSWRSSNKFRTVEQNDAVGIDSITVIILHLSVTTTVCTKYWDHNTYRLVCKVHGREFLLQEHRPLHSVWQPHFIKSRTAIGAGLFKHISGVRCSSWFVVQPWFMMSGNTGWGDW